MTAHLPASLGKVAVLMGGTSAEREISILSGTGVLAALRSLGVDAHRFDPAERELGELRKEGFARCFIALHGRHGEDGSVQGALELLGIPYTGSDPFTLAVTLDKDCAKKLVAAAGIAIPSGYALEADESVRDIPPDRLRFPLVAKPAWEGSSKGIRSKCLVEHPRQLADVIASLRHDHRQTILLEEYIAGDELTVGIHGNDKPEIIGVMRVRPNQPGTTFIYSLEIKRDYRRLVTYDCPAPLPPQTLQAVERAALTAFRVLGCRDIARIDFRMRGAVPCFLEVNPLPGLNPEDSDLVIMSRLLNWSYERLVGTILDAAFTRCALR
jgi:D-alanine-D-alanine ligase